jgi:hypothetical protein
MFNVKKMSQYISKNTSKCKFDILLINYYDFFLKGQRMDYLGIVFIIFRTIVLL